MSPDPKRPSTRLGRATRELMRQQVFVGLEELVHELAWSEITMSQVALRVGVSRQTLYNEFGNRDELSRSYVLWASEGFLDEVERAVRQHRDDFARALQSALELFLGLARDHPMVRALVSTAGAEDLRALISTSAGLPLIATAGDRLAEIILDTWPGLPAGPIATFADTVVRLAISHLTVPGGTPHDAATTVVDVLSPYLAQFEAGRR